MDPAKGENTQERWPVITLAGLNLGHLISTIDHSVNIYVAAYNVPLSF